MVKDRNSIVFILNGFFIGQHCFVYKGVTVTVFRFIL